ncbi:hypothetical protein [Longimicrobium sp.]|nr:hypothetical protein [Longimicrobium sp.]HSU14922.1 hypothetical protein [Longimicrobium sp.]
MKKHMLNVDAITVETFSTAAQLQVEAVASTLRTCPTQEILCTDPRYC